MYEVVYRGVPFAFENFRLMSAFARRLEREGYEVRCRMRLGASAVNFKQGAWA